MKRGARGVFLSLIAASLLLAGCGPGEARPTSSSNAAGVPTVTMPLPVGDIVPTPRNAAAWNELRKQVAAARAVAERIIGVFPPNKPETYLTLSTFYRPHALSAVEKDQILAIAQAWEPLRSAVANPDVVEMDVRDYFWKSFSNESAVTVSDALLAKRGVSQKLLDYMGFDVLPGVFILFHTSHDSYAYAAVKIVVSPAAHKVVYTEAAVTAAQPPQAGGWDNVNPDSFRLDYADNLVSPLNPNYDPSGLYGPEGTRFGPPWDRVQGLIGAASPTVTATAPGASPTISESESIFNQFNYYSISVEIIRNASGQKLVLKRDDPRYAELMRVFNCSINAPGGTRTGKGEATGPATTVPYVLGNILTFKLLDGSNLVFNCATENVWFETKDFIYRRALSEDLRVFLDGLLAHPDAPELSPIAVIPAAGQLLFQDSNSKGIVLKSVAVRPGVLERDYTDIRPPGTIVKKGEACLLLTGQVESQLEQDRYMTMVAKGYNAAGEEVAHVLDAGPIYGVISIFLPAKGFDGFIIHLNAATDVTKIELFPSDRLYDIPPP